jgi:hypothetical protein
MRHNNICLFKRICHPGFQFSGEAVHPLAQKNIRAVATNCLSTTFRPNESKLKRLVG